jgi:hypothetical protein
MTLTGSALADATEELASALLKKATEVRNTAFVVAGQNFLEPFSIDPHSENLRNVLTRIRGDGDDDLPNNIDILLSGLPELANIPSGELERVATGLAKTARAANKLVSIQRVNTSIVRAVLRPLFYDYPLERLAIETGSGNSFSIEESKQRTAALGEMEVSTPEEFESWSRSVFELFQSTSVIEQLGNRSLTGTRMPGVVSLMNLRRYTNVWFDFVSSNRDQIFELAKISPDGNKLQNRLRTTATTSRRIAPKYSSVSSDFTYTLPRLAALKISLTIASSVDKNIFASREWNSKTEFLQQAPGWITGVIDIWNLDRSGFILDLKITTASGDTSMTLKDRGLMDASEALTRFVQLSI